MAGLGQEDLSNLFRGEPQGIVVELEIVVTD